jgi:hypothetical protein
LNITTGPAFGTVAISAPARLLSLSASATMYSPPGPLSAMLSG